jgi:hypothetical protein
MALFGREHVERYRETDGEEGHERLWKLMTAAWPAYDDHQMRTDRQIPVVLLTRT